MAYASIGMGVFLIVAETYRRWGQWADWPVILDDWLVGGLLILGGLYSFKASRKASGNVSRSVRIGRAIMLAAWAALAGGLYYSVLGSYQVWANGGTDPAAIAVGYVLLIKLIIWAVAIACVVVLIKDVASRSQDV